MSRLSHKLTYLYIFFYIFSITQSLSILI